MSTITTRSRARASAASTSASPISRSLSNRRPSHSTASEPPRNRTTQAAPLPANAVGATLIDVQAIDVPDTLVAASDGANISVTESLVNVGGTPTCPCVGVAQVVDVEAQVDTAKPLAAQADALQFTVVQGAPLVGQADMSVPEAVKRAIAAFESTAEYTLSPPRHNESSFIYKWGVRVTHVKDDKEQVGWICLANQNCRDNIEVVRLYSGKTSQATKHLKHVHNCTSEKYTAELSRKRTREEELDDLRASLTLNPDPKRMRLLVETKRVIMNRLPLRSVESDEFRLVSELCMKEEFQRPLSARLVRNTIVELYVSAKREIISLLRENDVMDSKLITVMADFWTCKPQHKKYLGVRIYFIDKSWKMRSILLGNPGFLTLDSASVILPWASDVHSVVGSIRCFKTSRSPARI